MNFSKFDVSILLVMSLTVVIMSFTFPALGLTDQSDQVNETDIPEFNISSGSVNLVGEFPDEPKQPTSGTLEYDNTQINGLEGVNLVYIDRPKDTGAAIEVQNSSAFGLDLVYTNFTSTGSDVHRYDINNNTGQEILINQDGWTIETTVTEISNYNESDMTVDVEYDIKSNPDSSEGLSSIPLIGNFADGVANVVGSIAVQFAWFSAVLVELIINAILTIVDLTLYLFSMMYWLISTYSAVVSAAPAWAAVFLAVPGILLFAEFAKIVVIIIDLFPTT
jgi:hypothetical protein